MSQHFHPLRALLAAWLLLASAVGQAATTPDADEEAAVAALQDAYALKVTPGEAADVHRQLLATVLRRVKRSSAMDVDLRALSATAMRTLDPLPAGAGQPAEVFKRAVNDALRTLDAQSRYLEPRAVEAAGSDDGGSFVGLGIQLEPVAGAVRVVAPMPGGPAERAGVAAGDLIVRVDDQPLKDLPLADAIARMRGQAGTPVTLAIQREGKDQEILVSVTRGVIRPQVLRWNMQGDVLVLRLGGFTSAASSSIADAVRQATATRQPRGVVLDLRGNPGGLLREAVRVADAFLAQGEIVSLRGSNSARLRAWSADPEELLPGIPMAVLVDRRSASASELVADALQQQGRATVLGQRSFGKGSVQTILPLGEKLGALKLTTAIYHGPNGETLNHVGITPDIELAVTPANAQTAAGEAAPANAPASLRAAKVRVNPDRCSARKVPDPVLACAVSYVLAGNVETFVRELAD